MSTLDQGLCLFAAIHCSHKVKLRILGDDPPSALRPLIATASTLEADSYMNGTLRSKEPGQPNIVL